MRPLRPDDAVAAQRSSILLAMVRLDVIVLAHTASRYSVGRTGEARLLARLEALSGTRVVTAAGAVIQASAHLGVRRIALGTPYAETFRLRLSGGPAGHSWL